MSNELTTVLPLNVYKKLLKVKEKIDYIKKDAKGYNYSYASPSAVFGQVNPVLNDLGLILITNVVDSKSYEITTKNGKGGTEKQEWKFDLNFIFDWVDVETGEKLSIPWSASGCNGEDKGLGSALTYAERYFVLKQFNIPTDSDDPDAFQEKHLSKEEKATAEKQKAEEKAAADKLVADNKIKEDAEKQKAFDTSVKAANKSLESCKTLADLAATWTALSKPLQAATAAKKDELKAKLKPATPAQ